MNSVEHAFQCTFPSSRRSKTEFPTHNHPQIQSVDVKQIPLRNILHPPQMHPSHSPRVGVTIPEAFANLSKNS
ncbi:MAG: hypothetical protein ACP5I1_16855 [Candidatus Hinthialibacter sp.]